jgi:hypothetical protein
MRWFAGVVAAGLAGCASTGADWTTPDGRAAIHAAHRDEPWTHVAACSGIDWMTLGHVTNVLLVEGIPSYAGGSVLYGIEVPQSLAARAHAVLVERQRPDVYACSPTDSGGGPTGSLFVSWGRPEAGAVTRYGIPVADALAQPSLDPRVADALREEHVADLLPRLPVLDLVELWERPYLGDDGAWRRGAHLRVRLVNAAGSPQGFYELTYTVWDGEARSPRGGPAMFQGGSGAGPAVGATGGG